MNADYDWSSMFSDIENAGAEYLDLNHTEATWLFDSQWCAWWWKKAGLEIPSDSIIEGYDAIWGYAVPKASEAATILESMAKDGEVWLEP